MRGRVPFTSITHLKVRETNCFTQDAASALPPRAPTAVQSVKMLRGGEERKKKERKKCLERPNTQTYYTYKERLKKPEEEGDWIKRVQREIQCIFYWNKDRSQLFRCQACFYQPLGLLGAGAGARISELKAFSTRRELLNWMEAEFCARIHTHVVNEWRLTWLCHGRLLFIIGRRGPEFSWVTGLGGQ